MDPWRLRDGTLIHLGGDVAGDSVVADTARAIIRRSKSGEWVATGFGAVPEDPGLDIDVPHLLDSWIRIEFGAPVSAPKFDIPENQPRPEPPEGGVY